MSQALLNLSTRPFVNLRPVVRLSLILWVAGLVLLAGNLWLYWDFLAGRGDVDARRREAAEGIAVEQNRIQALSSELSRFDLGAQNEQVVYLNQRIEQRRFSWSRLFDELADLLPRDVRLTSLQPSTGDAAERRPGRTRSTRRSESSIREGQVLLEIEGRARNDQAILDFVDALFGEPDFERPNLLGQAREQGGAIRFELEVYYQPDAAAEPELLPLLPGDSADGDPIAEGVAGPGATDRESDGGSPNPTVALGRPASSPRELR